MSSDNQSFEVVIYKIFCLDPNITDCYIGSTSNYFVRLYFHGWNCNNPKSSKHHFLVYKFIRDNGGWSNWKMEPIQHYQNCTSKDEKLTYERLHIDRFKPTLNKYLPKRTRKEYQRYYYQKTQNAKKQYQREYYNINKDIINESHDCECGGKYSLSRLSAHKLTSKHQEYLYINSFTDDDQ
jgi:hypothetical protein